MYIFSWLNCSVAMRPKSAFIPASVPLLSHDTGDDEDDDDERQKGASSFKGILLSSWSVVNSQQVFFILMTLVEKGTIFPDQLERGIFPQIHVPVC